MSIVPLQRAALKPLYQEAWDAHPQEARDAHPGLLVQRGLLEYDSEGSERKTDRIRRICDMPASELYHRAFARWREATSDPIRFRARELALESRLFIGLSAGGMLETGCAISHSYGVPYIPGSSIKGAVRAYVESTDFGHQHAEVCHDLFGVEPNDTHPEGLSGLFTFHDAWWVPGSADRPLVQEVVTTHHLDYYASEGDSPATDLDSPIPNAQIAVRGSFLFVVEGPQDWMQLTEEMLIRTLTDAGLGAKRRAGYGYFADIAAEGTSARCAWVEDTIARLAQANRSNEEETLRGKALSGEWKKIEDADVKRQALEDIRSRWQAKGWWDQPPGRAARQAKAIYDGEGS